ncbi:MAG: CRISPR-associated protein Cas4 [Verrucomicrobiales bacterium]|nr:CRISPR-associated protein Cas4 [Verrucomicrobiales bacterium]
MIDYLPLSGLQHYLYCPRQCALIHVEQEWSENRFTAEGNVLHEKAHSGADEHRVAEGVKITRSLPVRSEVLGLSGTCDIVEFHYGGKIVPVEYKRGKPKGHRADEVQLCAQAMCLGEMLDVSIMEGFIFYGKRRRRTEVAFDLELRRLVGEMASGYRDQFESRTTPPAEYDSRKCGACSLIEICQPQLNRKAQGAAEWFDGIVFSELSEES